MSTEIQDEERLDLPSASSAERLINCRGSRLAEQGMLELPAAKVAQDGTDIHEALETGDDSALDETEAQVAKRLQAMESRALEAWMSSYGIEETPVRHAEERLWIRDRKSLDLVSSAKLDVFYISGEYALVIDFKSGYRKATSSDRNWQLLVQAICLHHEFPTVKHFRVAIAASRLSSSLDLAEYTVEEVLRGEKEYLHAVWLSMQPNQPRTPGSWCQYCRANGHCAEAASYSNIILFENGKLKTWDKLSIVEAVSRMTPEQMAHVFVKSKVAAMIFGSVEDRLKAMPESELVKLGMSLKPGAERRVINDFDAAATVLLSHLSPLEISACVTMAPAKVQKALQTKKKLTVEKAKALTAEILSSVMTTKQNAASLQINEN